MQNEEDCKIKAILFAQYVAENHYVLVNKIGKIYFWENEYGIKTTQQIMQDYQKIK